MADTTTVASGHVNERAFRLLKAKLALEGRTYSEWLRECINNEVRGVYEEGK